MTFERLQSSFRDPAGFVFRHEGVLYRQVDKSHGTHYDLLLRSGLYDALRRDERLIAHEEIDGRGLPEHAVATAHKILRPALVPYVSYPYEWSFSQLKEAALLTLSLQHTALEHGMTLKDASAYNVQFVGCRPVFIDTLSFEPFHDGTPWVAYGQFCRHFLAPLALAELTDLRTQHLLRHYIDGVPLDLVSRLLPYRSFARYGLLAHIHAHAATDRRYSRDFQARDAVAKRLPMTLQRQLALVASLRAAVERCRAPAAHTAWLDYYRDNNYSTSAMASKRSLVESCVKACFRPDETVHDLGANSGDFSRLIAPGRYVVSHDMDVATVEQNHRENTAQRFANVLALVLDLTNPAPALGWAHAERDSFVDRARGSAVLALALVHHLAISNNLPLTDIAEFFARIADKLIVEFVPKGDSQLDRMLTGREHEFPEYGLERFEEAFGRRFAIRDRLPIEGTRRTLFVMERKAGSHSP